MPNIAKILKDEITRLARKEARASLDRTRKAVTQQRQEIADLKGQLKALERKVLAIEKKLAKSVAASPEVSAEKSVRFVPKGLVSMRKRLGLSAADLAKVIGVSGQTIYNWERGATKPKPEQQAKLVSLRRVGKRELRAHMASQEA